ncbi:MAG: hypothetical protein WD005_00675 [Haliea sp.]
MGTLPRERLDSTLAFVRNGYSFISKRCERYGSDAFFARLKGAVNVVNAVSARTARNR